MTPPVDIPAQSDSPEQAFWFDIGLGSDQSGTSVSVLDDDGYIVYYDECNSIEIDAFNTLIINPKSDGK